MQRDQALNALAALAHGDRLDLIRLLVVKGADGMAAGRIAACLGLSASRLSFHLSALEQAGLIAARRDARNIIYTVRTEVMGGLLAYLMHDCCSGDAGVMACARHHPPASDPASVPWPAAKATTGS